MRRGNGEMAPRGSAAAAAPFDVLAAVFLHTDLADLYNCQLVCQSWRRVARDDLVLRALCWKKGYASGSRRLSDLEQPYRPRLRRWEGHSDGHHHPLYRMQGSDDAASWEEVLKRDHLLRRIKFPPQLDRVELPVCDTKLHGVVKCYSNHERELRSDIWQVKIDPIDNVMITTGSRGGLTVLDLKTGQELWRDAGVVSFARLEQSEGWIVHDQDSGHGQGSHLEVRKFERLVDNLDNPRRGHLATVGTVFCPTYPRAWCLVWPHLAVATGAHVTVCDVRDLRILHHLRLTADFCQPPRYISMDEDFIFVLGGYRAQSDRADFERESEQKSYEEGGLFVYERKKDGQLVYDGGKTALTCILGCEIEEDGLGQLRLNNEALEACPSLGIANRMWHARYLDGSWSQYTSWCQAVLPGQRTGSLVLSGRGCLLVIPNYKKAFAAGQAVYAISIGADRPFSRRCTSQLGVADGVAAFVSSVHNLPVWVDLRSLIVASSRSKAPPPRISTLCLGQSLLYDSTAVVFQRSSCVTLDSTRLVVVADYLQEDASKRPITIKSYSLAVTMDFGAILQAKLANPTEPLDREPTCVPVVFPRRTSKDEAERARWREQRDEWSSARVVLPSGEAQWWEHWAPHLLAQPPRKRWKALRTYEGAERRQKQPPRTIAWRGRVAWGGRPNGTHLWDGNFTEEAMAKFFGPPKGADRGVDPENVFDSDGGEVEVVGDLRELGYLEGEDGVGVELGCGDYEDEKDASSSDDGEEEDEADDEGGEDDGCYDYRDENESIEGESGDPHDARKTYWTDDEDEFWKWLGRREEQVKKKASAGAPRDDEVAAQGKEDAEKDVVLFNYEENAGYSHRQLPQEAQPQLGVDHTQDYVDDFSFYDDPDEEGDQADFDAASNQEITGGASYVPVALRPLLRGSTSRFSDDLRLELPIDS